MKLLKATVLFILIWNIFVIVSALVLDIIDPYYAVQQTERELTEEELIAECPDAVISEADKEFLLSICNDPVVRENLPVKYGDMLWLSEDDCSRIISQYQDAPTDISRISVSQSGNKKYISVEFYETEDDKGEAPSTAYPCLCLTLQVTDRNMYNMEGTDDLPIANTYWKEVYNYSLKVPDNRIGTSSWGGPDASYRRYSCDTSQFGTPFEYEEKVLVPMKHRHLYLRYFGWFEAMMSV